MIRTISLSFLTAILFAPAAAWADPPHIGDDEGYSRLAQWESHLDERIAQGMRERWLRPDRAWRIQKDLDNVELNVLKSYYDSDRGIDEYAFRRYAGQLRQIGSELSDYGWSEPGYVDDNAPGYGPGPGYGPPQPGPGYGPPQQQPGYGQPYYQQGAYESQCHQNNNKLAGTIFGALGGGLIGGAASHGNGGAIAGGVILGGLLGNALSQDIDCDDHQAAFATYQQSFNGDVNRDYQWRHRDNYGTVTSTREYYRDGYVCRNFHSVNYRDGQRYERNGTACRQSDGYWHFD